MATLIKRPTKAGITYRVQVSVKNKGTGKYDTKVTTWKAPQDMTVKEAKKAALKYSMEYEEQVKKDYNLQNTDNKNLTLKGYSERWTQYVKKNKSPTYYQSILHHLKIINESLGCYQLKELNPLIIQHFCDSLISKKKSWQMAESNVLAKILKERNSNKTKMERQSGVSRSTIDLVFKGKEITLTCANKIAKALFMKIEDVFKINTYSKLYDSATISKTCRTLRSMLSMAKRHQVIEHNYASNDYITFVKEERKEVVYLDDIQIKKLISALKEENDIRIKTALMLLIFTGFRRGELCGLEWDDIDFIEKTIKVQRSSTHVTNQGVITSKPKTKTSARTIAIPDLIIQLLNEYKEWWNNFTKMLGDRYKGCKRLFLQKEGTALHPSTLIFWLRKITRKFGLPAVTIHSLRHTNITMQIIAGIPLKTVSVRAGHSSTKVTSDVYSHFVQSSDRAAADKLGEMLG